MLSTVLWKEKKGAVFQKRIQLKSFPVKDVPRDI